jgi:hypothetical protein
MNEVLVALWHACGSLLHPRMLLLMIWPMALAVLLWSVVAALFGAQSVHWLQDYLNTSLLAEWSARWFSFGPVAAVLGWFALFVLFVPLVLITASLIVGIFGMNAVVDQVASRDYPNLQRKHGNGIAAMTFNALAALLIFLALSLISLPLWFVPVLWPVLPVLLLAYFNQRMFRFDALAEHADKDEMRRVCAVYGRDMFLLAILLSIVAHIPIIGFFTPVLAGLAFVHYCLARLSELRSAAPKAN